MNNQQFFVNGRWMNLKHARLARGLDKPEGEVEVVEEAKEVEIVVEPTETETITSSTGEDIVDTEKEYTMNELHAMCKEKGISYHILTGRKKLMKLLEISK